MKAIVFFTALLMFLCIHTLEVAGQSSIGIRAGVISSRQNVQNGDIENDYKSKLGADIALIAEFPIGLLSIRPEFHWIQKGGKIEDLNGPIGEVSQTFNYLEIPLLAKLNFGSGVNFFLLGGPSIGYLLNGTDKDMDGNTNDIDLDFYKRAEWGLHVGGGLGLGPLQFDLRYIAGLSNVIEDSAVSDDIRITNESFGAGITLIF